MKLLFSLIIIANLFIIQTVCNSKSESELELEPPLILRPIYDTESSPKIAIIGAGAGGSSAANYLQRFTSHYYNITIYESEEYIGGRSTTIDNYSNGKVNLSIELGASVFVSANRILWNAVREFNLSTTSFNLKERYPGKFKGDVGIWNGTHFVFKTKGDENMIGGFWKLFWEYGLSPLRLYWLVRDTVGKFVHFFYYTNFPFQLNDDSISQLGFDKITGMNGINYLSSEKISEIFSKNIVEASTRVNYASNLDEIHGLETLVSMSAEEVVSVIGGNYQIFENFIKNSSANLLLNTKVSKISQMKGDYKWIVESDIGIDFYDTVIIATPLSLSGIIIEGEKISKMNPIEYRELFVTYVSTPRTNPIDHEYFGNDDDDDDDDDVGRIPEMILTRSATATTNDSIDEIPFFSINIVEYNNITDEIIYKIFSPREINNKIISSYLFKNLKNVSIIFSKKWEPYPILKPQTKFNNFQIGDNLWYLNTMEEFISTMETSALAGASVAGLISRGKNTTEIHLPYY